MYICKQKRATMLFPLCLTLRLPSLQASHPLPHLCNIHILFSTCRRRQPLLERICSFPISYLNSTSILSGIILEHYTFIHKPHVHTSMSFLLIFSRSRLWMTAILAAMPWTETVEKCTLDLLKMSISNSSASVWASPILKLITRIFIYNQFLCSKIERNLLRLCF